MRLERDVRDRSEIPVEISETPEIPRTKRRSHAAMVSPRLTSAQSPLAETPRKPREKRPYATKA